MSGPISAEARQWEVFDAAFRGKTTVTTATRPAAAAAAAAAATTPIMDRRNMTIKTSSSSSNRSRTTSSAPQQTSHCHNNRHHHNDDDGIIVGDGDHHDGSRVFAWMVLLHGCLFEAPLAVTEGLVRAPLYLLAAVWVSVVGLVGASQREHQVDLSNQATALAREGLLLLSASVTLAVPLSAAFTVYRDVDAEYSDWDVRPIPTVLGAVDPLRFFVFGLGQAGELAANGDPEPLEDTAAAAATHPSTRPSSSSLPPSSLPPAQSSSLSQAAATYFRSDDESDDGVELSVVEGGRRCDTAAGSPEETTLLARSNEDGGGGSGRKGLPPFATRSSGGVSVGRIVAHSMDGDRLGVGILHPPKVIRLRLRRGGENARRAVVSAYRNIATSARRLRNKSTRVHKSTLARASSSSHNDGTVAAAAVG